MQRYIAVVPIYGTTLNKLKIMRKNFIFWTIATTIALCFGSMIESSAQEGPDATYMYTQRDTCSLYMDVYEPAEGKIMTAEGLEKPTIVFMFGGGFITGERNNKAYSKWFNEMKNDGYRIVSIDYRLGLKGYNIYGLSEIMGPGVSYECSEQNGSHINEDHFIAEIIDPDTGEVLPEGSKGELVFTALDKEAFPLLRYRTRDICILTRGKCSCGRTFVTMCKPMGRSDDMLIIRGVNVFPSQIETVLIQQGYAANYQIIVDRVNNTDTFEIMVEMNPEMFSDSLAKITAAEKALVDALKSMLGIAAKVKLVAPKSITRSEGKAVRVIDKRKI